MKNPGRVAELASARHGHLRHPGGVRGAPQACYGRHRNWTDLGPYAIIWATGSDLESWPVVVAALRLMPVPRGGMSEKVRGAIPAPAVSKGGLPASAFACAPGDGLLLL